MFRRNSREKVSRPVSANVILSRHSSSSLTSLHETSRSATFESNLVSQNAPTSQPTPPPSPSKNKLASEEEKSPSTSPKSTPSASPSASPKHGPVCPGSPSRNYRYYTTSSAELTPPGSPYRGRGTSNQTTGVTISNKNNTVVWHQGTPPSSPKRSIRKSRAALPDSNSETSPKSNHLKDIHSSESIRKLSDSSLQGAKAKSHSSVRTTKSCGSKPSKKNCSSMAGVEPRERVHSKSFSSRQHPLKSDKLKSSQIKNEQFNVVVKITSPTSPPTKDSPVALNGTESDIPYSKSKPGSMHTKSTGSLAEEKRLNSHKQKTAAMMLRQSSLPDDGLLHPLKEISTTPTRCPSYKTPLTKASSLVQETTLTSPGLFSNQFAKLDGTMSDSSSFNSATLSYATLFYNPRPNLRTRTNPYTPNTPEPMTTAEDYPKSIHLIRFPSPTHTSDVRANRHAVVAQNLSNGRPSSSAILRQRFASLNTHSFELDTRTYSEKYTRYNGSRKTCHKLTDNFDATLNNAPSLPQLVASRDGNRIAEQKLRSKNNNRNTNYESPKRREGFTSSPRQTSSSSSSSEDASWKNIEKISLKNRNTNRTLSSDSSKRALDAEKGTRKGSSGTLSTSSVNRNYNRDSLATYRTPKICQQSSLQSRRICRSSGDKSQSAKERPSKAAQHFKNENDTKALDKNSFLHHTVSPTTREKRFTHETVSSLNSQPKAHAIDTLHREAIANASLPARPGHRKLPSIPNTIQDSPRSSAQFHLLYVKSASCSPPTSRPCQAAELKGTPRAGSTSNVPSWMRQTISRILASTNPPNLKKPSTSRRREILTSERTT